MRSVWIGMLTFLLMCVGVSQAAFVWNETGVMVYDGLGVDSAIDPYTQSTSDGDINIAGTGGNVASLTVLSGELTIQAQTSWGDKVGHEPGGTVPAGDHQGAITVENGATLNWYINNDQEDRMMFGNNYRAGLGRGIAIVTLNGGVFNIIGDATFDHAEHQVRFGSDGGIGDLILNAGTMTISVNLPFAFGDKWLVNGTSWTTSANLSVSTMTINDGSLICSGSSVFGVGDNDKINFISGGTGKLSIKDWTSTEFAGLIGKLQIDGVDVTDLSGFSVGTEGTQGTLSVTAKTQLVAPANGAINVGVDQDLFWNVIDPNVTHVDLYFYTQSDPNLHLPANKKLSHVAATASMTYDPGILDNEISYCWSVDTYEPNGIYETLTPGGVWSFTTVGIQPEVTAVSPALTVADKDLHEDKQLSVLGTNVTSYQWYKEGVGTPLSNGADYDGVTTNTLTIYDVQLADEGDYYCQVDNDNPGTDPVNSDPGLVMTKRMILYYPLDDYSVVDGNTITPETTTGGYDIGSDMVLSSDVSHAGDGLDFPTPVTDDPNVQVGTGALLFDNSDSADPNSHWGQYAIAGDVDLEALGNGFTVELWMKRFADNGTTAGLVVHRNAWAADQMKWSVEVHSPDGGVYFAAYPNATNANLAPTTQDAWTHVAITHNGNNTARVYVNGVYKTESAIVPYASGVGCPLMLAASSYNAATGLASNFFNGVIDDVQFYNYVRTTAQIAQDYLVIAGGWVCDNEGTVDLTYDFNNNCQVDLGDFAMLAADWLNSNRIYAQ